MNTRKLVRDFARVLVAVAGDSITETIRAFRELAPRTRSPEVWAVVHNPRIDEPTKTAVVRSLTTAVLPDEVERVLALLVESRMLRECGAIADAAERIRDLMDGRQAVEVTSASALSDADAAALVNALEKRLGGRPRVSMRVRPELGAGVRVQMGSVVLDSTLKTSLERIGETLRTISRE